MRIRWLSVLAALLGFQAWAATALAEDVPGGVGSFDHGNQYAWIFAFAMLIIVAIALGLSYRRMKREWRSPGS